MQPEVNMTPQSTQSMDLALSTNKVLRNTYMMLGLTMIPTIIGAFIGTNLNLSFMAAHPVISFVGVLAVMFGFFFGISANRNNAFGVILLLGLTFFLGIILGPLLQAALNLRNGSQLIGLAAAGTGAIFFSLAGIAMVTRKDFSFLGNFLFIGLILALLAAFANIFFQVPAVSLAISSVVILIFSGYILYDVSRIVRGGETNYVMATLALYLDIYNIFTSLLHLLMAFMGERD